MAVIAYHPDDEFAYPMAFFTRYAAYGNPTQASIPLSVMDGSTQVLGGVSNLYDIMLDAYDMAAAQIPPVDISISREESGYVRVQVTNTSSSAVQGTLHIVLVERQRPFVWRDMNFLDFICRTMMPTPDGQAVTLAPSQNFASSHQFFVNDDWNYCSIVAFVQAADKRILQGAVFDLEESVPIIDIQGAPETGDLWLKGSSHSLSWSSTRPLSSLSIEYSVDGGSHWNQIQGTQGTGGSYNWTVPAVNSSRCLLAVRDPFGSAKKISGLFAIGIKGDFNSDGAVNIFDRVILVEHLTENRAAIIPGADLNADGTVDLFDLVEFDAGLLK